MNEGGGDIVIMTGGSDPLLRRLLCSTVARKEFLRISVNIYSKCTGTYLAAKDYVVYKNKEEQTHAKVASMYPSIITGGLAPKVASHSSDTNEAHISTIAFGEHFMSTTPT